MPLSAAERSKRYREKLKENPEKRGKYLENARKRAAKSKQHINDLTEREKRYRRKKWRLYQEKSRQKKKIALRELDIVREFTPPATPEPDIDVLDNRIVEINRSAGRKRVRKNKSASYIKIKKLQQELEQINKAAARYKKRYYRYKQKFGKAQKLKSDLTPNSKANDETKGFNVPPNVKKQLVFNNALVSQMRENYATSTNEREKQVISGILEGKILKKYRCQTAAKSRVGCYSRKKNMWKRNFKNTQKGTFLT